MLRKYFLTQVGGYKEFMLLITTKNTPIYNN